MKAGKRRGGEHRRFSFISLKRKREGEKKQRHKKNPSKSRKRKKRKRKRERRLGEERVAGRYRLGTLPNVCFFFLYFIVFEVDSLDIRQPVYESQCLVSSCLLFGKGAWGLVPFPKPHLDCTDTSSSRARPPSVHPVSSR